MLLIGSLTTGEALFAFICFSVALICSVLSYISYKYTHASPERLDSFRLGYVRVQTKGLPIEDLDAVVKLAHVINLSMACKSSAPCISHDQIERLLGACSSEPLDVAEQVAQDIYKCDGSPEDVQRCSHLVNVIAKYGHFLELVQEKK